MGEIRAVEGGMRLLVASLFVFSSLQPLLHPGLACSYMKIVLFFFSRSLYVLKSKYGSLFVYFCECGVLT